MKKNRLAISAMILTAMVIYGACRKIDMQPEKEELKSRHKFFNLYPSADKSVLAVQSYMMREELKYHFVDEMANRIGFPRWNKAIVLKGAVGRAQGRNNTEDADVIYIPFVRDGENFVNAMMQFSMTQFDTSWQGVCDWQYSDLGYDSIPANYTRWNAKKSFVVFATLDRAVFGHTEFQVTDGQILYRDSTDTFDVAEIFEQQSDRSTNANRSSSYISCITYLTCPSNGSARSNIVPSPQCFEDTWCEDPDEIFENGNGWFPGQQGGGGSGGGYIPPGCPGEPQRSSTANPNCPPRGWNPVPGSNPPPQTEPIDSILSKSARAINNKLDSIFQLSLASGHEWGLVVVKRNNSIYTINLRTDNDSNEVKTRRFLYLQPGEVAIGDGHTHPDPDSTGRSSPSGNDVEALRGFKNQQNYFHFVELGHIRYALVIQTPSLAQTFFNNVTGKYDLYIDHYNLAISDPAANTNWRLATERALIQLIGSSSTSGIAIYKSTNSAKTTFTKIN